MYYPYDKTEFSPTTKAYLELLRQYPLLEKPIDSLLQHITPDMDPEAAAVIHTMAHHSFPATWLAWRNFYYRGDDSEFGEQERIASWENYNITPDAPNRFDPAKGILLGESAGGEVYCGIHWDGGKLRFFEVDVEDELGEPIKVFESVDAFFDFICDSEAGYAEMEGLQAPEFLVDLYKAANKSFYWPN